MANTLRPRDPVEKLIGETRYKVTPLGAKQGCQVMTRITKLLGGAIDKTNSTNAAALVAGALLELSEENLSYFVDTFAKYTDINNEGTNGNWPGLAPLIELHFAANYGEMFEWLQFCIETNYGSLFERAKAALAKQKAAAEVKTPVKESS